MCVRQRSIARLFCTMDLFVKGSTHHIQHGMQCIGKCEFSFGGLQAQKFRQGSRITYTTRSSSDRKRPTALIGRALSTAFDKIRNEEFYRTQDGRTDRCCGGGTSRFRKGFEFPCKVKVVVDCDVFVVNVGTAFIGLIFRLRVSYTFAWKSHETQVWFLMNTFDGEQ